MVEIIKRCEGMKSERQRLDEGKLQISYNSDGHLVIRIINSPTQDTLVVLDVPTSREVMDFVKKISPKVQCTQCGREIPF